MKKLILKILFWFAKKCKRQSTYISAKWLKFLVDNDIKDIDSILMKVGVYPVTDFYYNPMINPQKYLYKSLRDDRVLPGIDFNVKEQIELCDRFQYQEELKKFPLNKNNKNEYYYNNGSFCSGDSEFLYNIIRYYKPSRLIEIGSGASTLMAINAIKKNGKEDSQYYCKHTCIEPYEQPSLESLHINLIRERVELIDKKIFNELKKNDILFIDSSHIIRPQGDVLVEYLNILPMLNSGVLVHIHDIFTPKDYLDEWIFNHSFWNEQYLLEAFLTFNKEFKIIGSLNFLMHKYPEKLNRACPILATQCDREPGSFWIQRN